MLVFPLFETHKLNASIYIIRMRFFFKAYERLNSRLKTPIIYSTILISKFL